MFVAMNFFLKLFSCAVIFMPIDHENKPLVEGERSRENIFWKQPQKVFGIYCHICVKLADANILRPPSACSKLRRFLAISMDCVSWFSSLFPTFPDRLRCVLVCLSMFTHKYCWKTSRHQLSYVYQTHFCVKKRQFFDNRFQ